MKRHDEPSSLTTGDEDEENYFVSLSDLMTGVLFVFVILTTALALHYHLKAGELDKARSEAVAAQGSADKAKDDAEKARKGAQGAKDDASKAREKAQQVQDALDTLAKVLRKREQLRKEELQRLVTLLGTRRLAVELDETNGILRLPEELLFRTGEAKLQASGTAAIELLAKEMLPVAREGCGAGPLRWEAIYIEGHTDNVPIRTAEFPSNWELSSARAISTFDALILSQPDLKLLNNHQKRALIGISGYGEQRPAADNSTEAGRKMNRRIDIRFVMAYPSQEEIDEMESKLEKSAKTMEAAKP